MEKNMENEMEAGIIKGLYYIIALQLSVLRPLPRFNLATGSRHEHIVSGS